MLDLRWIRAHPEALDEALRHRGEAPRAQEILALDTAWRVAQTGVQELKARRRNRPPDGTSRHSAARSAALALKAEIAAAEKRVTQALGVLDGALSELANIPMAEVPWGDERANEVVRVHGEVPAAVGAVPVAAHDEVGKKLGLMDFAAATRLSGARFVVLRGDLALLHRACAQYMLDLHTVSHGYTEIYPPYLVHEEAMFGTGQLPKFRDDQFQTRDGRWLIPTAEVPLTNLYRMQDLEPADLPLRLVAHTPCFRAEAGAAGRDTRGMIRQHQFDKVELVSLVAPDQGLVELERLLGCAEAVLRGLGLRYRVVLLAGGDLGFSAMKTYDLEVWFAAQQCYREISSCSLCGDFQARRMKTRVRIDGKLPYVHSLNGSGVAVGRALAALLEQYQQPEGSLIIPEVLRPYCGGKEVISADR